MIVKTDRIDRLYSTLVGYKYVLDRIRVNAEQTEQDLSYLLAELQNWREEVANHERISDVGTTLVDDSNELPGC